MFSTDDTIAAIATPLGRGALGIVRISGPSALAVARVLMGSRRELRAREATLVRIGRTPGAAAISDKAIAIYYPRPHSYTGDASVELSLHGGPAVLRGVLAAALAAGARLAEPGEFTLRAFLNGKLDLVQAEAVSDLIDAVTPLQARAAFDQLDGALTAAVSGIEARLFHLMAGLEASLDFPEEGYHFIEPSAVAAALDGVRGEIAALLARSARGRLLREGATVALVGSPNVGKSSLFNALLHANRAIVTPIAGTTRDLLSERIDMAGVAVSLVDTAGLRESGDPVEQEGVARTRAAMAAADLVLAVLDGSRPLGEADRAVLDATRSRRRLLVVNKVDLARAWQPGDVLSGDGVVEVSAREARGLDALVGALLAALGTDEAGGDAPLVTNVRHTTLLARAAACLERSVNAISSSAVPVSEEFLLTDIQDASACLQEIVGRRTSDDLLRHIFERFCIGK